MMFAAASTGAAAALSARAAGVLSGDPPNSASSCSSSCARASSIHASSWGRPRARRAAVVMVRASQHDWWPAPVTEAPVGQGSTALATHGSDLKHKDIRLRAKELANINPNDPRALDAIGSKVPCKVRFTVPYDTKLGEDVLIIGSHEKLGAWNQNNARAMTWSDGNLWFADLELPAGGIFFYKYVVKTDHGYKWQEGANNLLVLPDPWDIPAGSVFVVDDNFSGVSRDSQNQVRKHPVSPATSRAFPYPSCRNSRGAPLAPLRATRAQRNERRPVCAPQRRKREWR